MNHSHNIAFQRCISKITLKSSLVGVLFSSYLNFCCTSFRQGLKKKNKKKKTPTTYLMQHFLFVTNIFQASLIQFDGLSLSVLTLIYLKSKRLHHQGTFLSCNNITPTCIFELALCSFLSKALICEKELIEAKIKCVPLTKFFHLNTEDA